MLPVIIAVGPFRVYSNLLLLILAIILFGFMVWKKGRELHFDEVELFDATLMTVLWSILGSRILYILLLDFKAFGLNIWYWLNIVGKPGLWQFGVIVFGGYGAYVQAKKRKWDFFNFTDVLLTGYVLFQTITALGRFLNGNGYGILANNFFGLRFAGMLDKHLPIQLYEFLFYGIIFGLLLWVEGKYRTFAWYKGSKSEAMSGFVTATYLILTGFLGLIITPITFAKMTLGGLRLDAFWELLILVTGSILLYKRSAINPQKVNSWKPAKVKLMQVTDPKEKDKQRWSSDIFN